MWTCPKCQEQIERQFGVCWQCGTSRDGVEDPHFVREIDAALVPPTPPRRRPWLTSPHPVSNGCPQCGDTAHETTPAATRIAFVSDRLCRACGCRYTPPTPVWASAVFIVLGLLGLVGSAMDLAVSLQHLTLPAIIGDSVGLAIGNLSLAYGTLTLWRSSPVQAVRPD